MTVNLMTLRTGRPNDMPGRQLLYLEVQENPVDNFGVPDMQKDDSRQFLVPCLRPRHGRFVREYDAVQKLRSNDSYDRARPAAQRTKKKGLRE